MDDGGPGFSHIEKGMVFAWWAAVQSFVPVFTGGYADRFGYKLTVGVSVAIKIVGYLVMAWAIELAVAMPFLPGDAHDDVFWTFTAGALLLAFGTAVFKPGIQGIIAMNLTERTSSLGWSLFYQLVNIGGFLGPYLAGVMRLMEWRYVFVSCAVIVALNYLLLLTFPEPEKEQEEAESDGDDAEPTAERGCLDLVLTLPRTALGMCEPRLMSFLVVFSGFWFMFNQLFDLLPNYIDDWVDSSAVFAVTIAPLFALYGATPPEAWAGQVPQEHMINLNAGMCMLFAFLVGYATGKVRAMTAMIAGIFISAVAIAGLGLSTSGWVVLGAIVLFSLGELAASPTKMRYFSGIAPPGKKATYLGYINATNGIGWSIGSMVAGEMYQENGDKVELARRWMVEELNRDAAAVAEIPRGDVLQHLAEATEQTIPAVESLLYNHYEPNWIWAWFALIGLTSMLGLIAFDQIQRRKAPWEDGALIALAGTVAALSYGPTWAALFVGAMLLYLAIGKVAPSWLP